MLDAGMDQQQKIPTIYHHSTHLIFWETNSMAKEHATEKTDVINVIFLLFT